MKSRKLTRVASAVVLVVTLASALTITTAGASGPTLVVTPSTNLHNGEKVKVSGSGFKPGDSVFVVECLAKASGEANCDISHLVSAKIAKSGKTRDGLLYGEYRQDRQRLVRDEGVQSQELRRERGQRRGR